MRTDESGNVCPETLGEYREYCEAVGIKNNAALKYLDEKIEKQGADQRVIAADWEMRSLLLPMLMHE